MRYNYRIIMYRSLALVKQERASCNFVFQVELDPSWQYELTWC